MVYATVLVSTGSCWWQYHVHNCCCFHNEYVHIHLPWTSLEFPKFFEPKKPFRLSSQIAFADLKKGYKYDIGYAWESRTPINHEKYSHITIETCIPTLTARSSKLTNLHAMNIQYLLNLKVHEVPTLVLRRLRDRADLSNKGNTRDRGMLERKEDNLVVLEGSSQLLRLWLSEYLKGKLKYQRNKQYIEKV